MQIKHKIVISLLAAILLAYGEQLIVGSHYQHVSCQITTHQLPLILNLEVADTKHKRSRGLAYRRELPKDEGMLFVFSQPQICTLWGKNTLLPLDVAFIDENAKVVQIAKIEPNSLHRISSTQPVKYAIEVNRGVLANHCIDLGSPVSFL